MRAPGRGSQNCEAASCEWSWVGGTEAGSRCDTWFSALTLLLRLSRSEARPFVGQLYTLHCKPPSVWTSSHFLSTPGVCNGVSKMLSTQKKRKLVEHKQPLPRSLHSRTLISRNKALLCGAEKTVPGGARGDSSQMRHSGLGAFPRG